MDLQQKSVIYLPTKKNIDPFNVLLQSRSQK